MGVVIFVIGPASGELDRMFSLGEVSDEGPVEELTAVIAIEAEDGEREGFFDVFDLLKDAGFARSPYGALFCPAGGDIDEVDGIGVPSGSGIAAVGDGIGFEEARPRFIPLIGFDGEGACFRKRVPGLVVDRPRFV
jgi:hypothetical protein